MGKKRGKGNKWGNHQHRWEDGAREPRWIGIIALVRFASLGVGFAKYHEFAFLHTYANKATGVVCACFPVLYQMFGLTVSALILCGVASLSALEELAITWCSKELDRNVKGLFFTKEV